MRDADGGVAAVGFDPLVFFGVFEVCWIGHLAPGTVPKGARSFFFRRQDLCHGATDSAQTWGQPPSAVPT